MATMWTRALRRLGIGTGQAENEGATLARTRRSLRRVEDWEAQLVEAGVSEDWAPRIARRLEPLYRELGPRSADPLLQSSLATYEVQADAHAYVERNLRDVREVERLLGAFSGELEKLDEVLEVLAAYAQRMRTKPAGRNRPTLH